MASTSILMLSSDFIATTLNGALAAAATTATIGTSLDIPATNGILQIHPDSIIAVGTDEGPETVSYATYTTGTGALAGMVRGLNGTTDVAHASGAKVSAGYSVSHIKEFCGARATGAAAQENIADNSWTQVTLGTETYDIGANFASSTFTAPIAGYYQIISNVNWVNTLASKVYWSSIYVNGAATLYGISTGILNNYTTNNIADIIHLDATDTVKLYCYHNTGAATEDVSSAVLAVHLLVQD